MKRREARETVFCLIFEKGFLSEVPCNEIYDNALSYFDSDAIEKEPYVKNTFYSVFEHIEEIDALIDSSLANWDKDRISRVSRAILRLAVYEIKYAADIPTRIAVNEAVEIAKKYDDDKAFSFINGVLAKVIVVLGCNDE